MSLSTPRSAIFFLRWLAGFPTPGDSPSWRSRRATLFDAAWLACLAAVLARFL